MRKSLILLAFCSIICFSGCDMNISNPDVQKLNQKATEYMNAGNYEKAVGRLESIIELNPEYPATYYNLGVAYYHMEEFEDAQEAFTKALEKQPNFPDAYFSRAVNYDDWAYSIIEDDQNKDEDDKDDDDKMSDAEKKAKILECLTMAKADYGKYLELAPNSEDKNSVNEKIAQLTDEIKKYKTAE